MNINEATQNPSIDSTSSLINNFAVTIKGHNLFSLTKKIKVFFIDKLDSTKVYQSKIDERPSNEGDRLIFASNKSKTFLTLPSGQIGNTIMPSGDYDLVLEMESGSTNYYDIRRFDANVLSVTSIPYKGGNISTASDNSRTTVVGGDKIAVLLTPEQKNRINQLDFIIRDKFMTHYEMVENYAVLGIDPNVPDDLHSLVMRDLVTGNDIITFEDALIKTAIALGFKTKNNISFPDGSSLSHV